MKKRKLHIRIFAFLLLLSMLKIAFPVGEFFHNHHSGKELCTYAHGKKCEHDTHISQAEKHHDCMFFQLHQSFVFTTFVYHLLSANDTLVFFLKEEKSSLRLLYFLLNLFRSLSKEGMVLNS